MNNTRNGMGLVSPAFLVFRFVFKSPLLGRSVFVMLSTLLCFLPTKVVAETTAVAAEASLAVEFVGTEVAESEITVDNALSLNQLGSEATAEGGNNVEEAGFVNVETVDFSAVIAQDVEIDVVPSNADMETDPAEMSPTEMSPMETDLAAPDLTDQSPQRALPTDVQPSDWAFEAVSALVQRYDCLAGFPDGSFRGDQSLTRFEFAAALHACFSNLLEREEELEQLDLVVIDRLQEDFATELAGLQEALDALGTRVTELEGNQFSRNFKLNGEIAFIVADDFGDGANPDDSGDAVFQNRVRLQLSSSVVEGWDDIFIARLTSGDIANGFTDEIGTGEGSFVFAGDANNDITLDRLHYYFTPLDKLRVSVLANFAGHHFYADTLNPGLEAGGGADGALFQLTERNPIYRLGLGGEGSGLGLSYKATDALKFEAGYIAANAGVLGSDAGGLFSGRYSAMGQIVYEPSKAFEVALTYLNTFDTAVGPGGAGGNIRFGAMGTSLADLPASITGGESDASSNTIGLTSRWDITPKISLRSFAGYTNVDLKDLGGNADILTYGGTLAFPNLFKENALGAITVGAEPYVTSVDTPGASDFPTDIPLQVSAMYRYPITDRLSITPGFVWLTAPNQDSSNDDAVVGIVRTTFKF